MSSEGCYQNLTVTKPCVTKAHPLNDSGGSLWLEMTQWLGALAALPEDPAWIPSTHTAEPFCNQSQGIQHPHLAPRCYCICVDHRHTCRQNIHAHKINPNKKQLYQLKIPNLFPETAFNFFYEIKFVTKCFVRF